MQDGWTDYMLEVLMQASELASVEGAQGAFRLLTCAHRLLRYISLDEDWAPLEEELSCLSDYIAIRQARFGNRIRLEPFAPGGLFVERTCALKFLDKHVSAEAMLFDPTSEWCVTFSQNKTALIMRIEALSQTGEHVYIQKFSL